MNPHQSQVAAWQALLALRRPDRHAFLEAAVAFVAAGDTSADPFHDPVAAAHRVSTTSPVSLAPAVGRDRGSKAPVARLATRTLQPACNPAGPSGLAVPPIGGPALNTEPSPLFTDQAFRQRWRPGRRLLVYQGGHRLLKNLILRLQPPGTRLTGEPGLCAYKIGTHVAGTDLSERLDRLTADGYGQLWRRGSTMAADPACGRWVLEPMHPGCVDPAPGSPVRIGVEAIELVLPASMTPSGFDQQLGKRLCSASLAAVALSASGRAYCEQLGEDPARFVRYSPRGTSKARRATEITLITRNDIGRLLRVIEDILIDHVLAENALA